MGHNQRAYLVFIVVLQMHTNSEADREMETEKGQTKMKDKDGGQRGTLIYKESLRQTQIKDQ